MLGGCADADSSESATPGATAQAREVTLDDFARLDGKATIELTLESGGTVIAELDGDSAPLTAGNFVDLVQREVYDGTVFHRVVREPQPFVVQGGDPVSKDESVAVSMLGRGNFTDPDTGRPRYIPLEILPEEADEPIYGQTFRQARENADPELMHARGALAMARSQSPNSASAQFYFALADLPFLDGDYAVFGYVTEGMDVVDGIAQGDRIASVRVTSGLDNFMPAPSGEAESE
ncbi:MAG: peptidylprolyl isomerase [Geitlerinemataceae cyanobacterium]